MTSNSRVVSPSEWTAKRIELLEKEKVFRKLRDELGHQIRSLPWERVEKEYVFQSPEGPRRLADLFGDKSQLIVYHFMFAEDSEVGCPSCSLITDSLNPTAVHLRARDVAMALVSRAPIERLIPFKKRLGWGLPWVSSQGSDFNQDFQASPTEVTDDGRFYYNYEVSARYPVGEQPGLSVFSKSSEGEVFHTYSTYARGLETFMDTYSLLDIVPKGRDEVGLPWGMAWVRHNDAYQEPSAKAEEHEPKASCHEVAS